MAPMLSAFQGMLLQDLLIWAACRQQHQAFSQPSMQHQLLCCSRQGQGPERVACAAVQSKLAGAPVVTGRFGTPGTGMAEVRQAS